MSVKIMTMVWEHAPCRENALIVLLALADWSNDSGECWPSIQKLADKTRIDRRSAQRIIRRLAKDNLITIEEGGGRAKQHRYKIETAALCRPLENSDFQNSDFPCTERAALRTERATFPTQTATPVSPDPLVDPLEEPSVDPLGDSPPFSSSEFRSALKDFEQHRREKRIKVTPTARRLMFKKFSLWGEERSIAALIHSTEKGYTGCFEENGNGAIQQRNGYETAAEKRGRNFRSQIDIVNQLRRESLGSDNESESGPNALSRTG
jgi:hypothetical protein